MPAMLWHVLLPPVKCWAPSALLKTLQLLFGWKCPLEAAYKVPAAKSRPSMMSNMQHSAPLRLGH